MDILFLRFDEKRFITFLREDWRITVSPKGGNHVILYIILPASNNVCFICIPLFFCRKHVFHPSFCAHYLIPVGIIFTIAYPSRSRKTLRVFRVNRIYDRMFWTTSRGLSCKPPTRSPWQFPGENIPNSIPVDRPYGILQRVTYIKIQFNRSDSGRKKTTAIKI